MFWIVQRATTLNSQHRETTPTLWGGTTEEGKRAKVGRVLDLLVDTFQRVRERVNLAVTVVRWGRNGKRDDKPFEILLLLQRLRIVLAHGIPIPRPVVEVEVLLVPVVDVFLDCCDLRLAGVLDAIHHRDLME